MHHIESENLNYKSLSSSLQTCSNQNMADTVCQAIERFYSLSFEQGIQGHLDA